MRLNTRSLKFDDSESFDAHCLMPSADQETGNPFGDYLQSEATSDVKHEYIAGRVYAMSGGTVNHHTVSMNFARHAGNQLHGKTCRTFNSDLKIRIPLGKETAFYYPDASIICTPLGGNDHFTDSPTVILEVLNPSTRRIDEVQKFRDYLTIPSLQVYLLAEADLQKVTVYRRKGEILHRETIAGPYGVLDLPEVEVSILLGDLYAEVQLP